MDSSTIYSVIKTTPNDPVKIFEKLGLPITYIEDVILEKNGRNRVFKFRDKAVFSPEIVAVVHYEQQGHVVNWNEGVALTMIREALHRIATQPLFAHFEYVGIKPEAFLPYASLNEQTGVVTTRLEAAANEQVDSRNVRKPSQEEIGRKHEREQKVFSEKTDFPFSFTRMKERELSWTNMFIESLVSVRCNCTAEALTDAFHLNLERIRANKGLLIEGLQLPEKTGDKTDGKQRFINEWTLKFAKSIVEICDFEYLVEEAFRYTRLSPRWDLMLIDKDTKKLRYIEVKLNDDFTQGQLTELPFHLTDGGSLELCVVKPKLVS